MLVVLVTVSVVVSGCVDVDVVDGVVVVDSCVGDGGVGCVFASVVVVACCYVVVCCIFVIGAIVVVWVDCSAGVAGVVVAITVDVGNVGDAMGVVEVDVIECDGIAFTRIVCNVVAVSVFTIGSGIIYICHTLYLRFTLSYAIVLCSRIVLILLSYPYVLFHSNNAHNAFTATGIADVPFPLLIYTTASLRTPGINDMARTYIDNHGINNNIDNNNSINNIIH